MSDESTPAPSDRDAEVAAALAVPALDDTTRRRLVRTAVAEADAGADDDRDELASRRSGRLVAAIGLAAALVIGAVVGTVIVTQPEDPSTETAARAPATTGADAGGAEAKTGAPAAPDAAGPADSRAAEAPAAVAPPVDLGDLGPVPNADGIRIAVNERLEAGTGAAPGSNPCFSPSAGRAGIYGLVIISAVGSATLDGETVVLLVGPTRQGENVAVVLDAANGCEFVRNVHL